MLHSPLSVSLHKHLNSSQLLHSFILCGYVVIYEQVLSHEYPLLIDDVVEFALFLLDDILLVLLLIVVIVILLVVKVLLRLLLLLILQVVELVEDVLDLALELLVALLHEVLEHLGHAQLLRFLSQSFTRED